MSDRRLDDESGPSRTPIDGSPGSAVHISGEQVSIYGSVTGGNVYGTPAEESGARARRLRAQARASLSARRYDLVISSLGEIDSGYIPEDHYVTALALLRGLPPSRHRSVDEIRSHLGLAASLPEARALHLLVEDDFGAARNRPNGAISAHVGHVVASVSPEQAREICAHCPAINSALWRELRKRGQGEV
jgi:hypothetical protein